MFLRQSWHLSGQALRSVLLACLCATVLSGCGSSEADEFVDAEGVLSSFEEDRRRHDPRNFVEVDLGEFLVTKRKTASQVASVRFHIYGVVPEKQREAFEDALARRDHQMRDAIRSSVQASDIDNLTDPSLGWIRAELIPTVNRSLHTRILRDVVFSEFTIEGAK